MSSRLAMENNGGNDQSGEMLKDNYFDPREVPAGYKFCPTDYELIVEYLRKKINKVPLDRRHLHIQEVNIYKYNPMQLSYMYKLEKETEWYFFTPRSRKYTNGSRPDRDAHGGHWTPTETKEPVTDQHNKTVGYKRTLAFYLGLERDKKNKKSTDWLMHEYTLEKKSNPVPNRRKLDCVLVKIYKKRGADKKEGKNQQAVNEFGPGNNSGDGQPQDDKAQIPQAPQPFSWFVEMQNQAYFLRPYPSPMLSIPPLVELPAFPQQHFFNDMGHYNTPNYGLCFPFGPQVNQVNQLSGPPPQYPQLNQIYQLSGPPPQQAFRMNEVTNLEPHNFGQFNPVSENGMQLQQQIVTAEAQLGECSNNNQMVLGGCQSGDLGLRNDPSYRIVIEDDNVALMDLLLAD